MEDSLAIEGSASSYGNILAVKAGNEDSGKTKALKAALRAARWPTTSLKPTAAQWSASWKTPAMAMTPPDYESLAGATITVAASPAPHAEILKIAKGDPGCTEHHSGHQRNLPTTYSPTTWWRAAKLTPTISNTPPYLEDFNQENGTHLVAVATIHVEPLGLYGGKQTSLDPLLG